MVKDLLTYIRREGSESDTRWGGQMDLRNLRKLLKEIETAPAGSPELDRNFVKAFRSAPPNVTCSIDAAVRLIETELPGWWWNCGYCALRNGASLYVPGSSRIGVLSDYKPRPEDLQLLQDPKWGPLFDKGFHCDRGGTVPLAILAVFLQARIAVELCEQFAYSAARDLSQDRK